MTDEVELHVGYVGRTWDGKRVEIVDEDRAGVPFLGDNNVWYFQNGKRYGHEVDQQRIIGPWAEPTTEYPVGQWIGWNGGECPVHPETKVEVVPHSGMRVNLGASSVSWSGDLHIIAFRIVTPYVEPKPPLECWVNVYSHWVEYYNTKADADMAHTVGRIRCVRMVEADQ